MSLASIYNSADKKTQRIAKTIAAATVILTAAMGVCGWVSSQFESAVSAQINDFREENREYETRHEQAITRVELGMLMEHDPENVVAIEKMARYYFHDLDGDLYMTQKYSDWAKSYGGDITIILKGD